MRCDVRTSAEEVHFRLRLDPEDGLEGSGQMGMRIELVTDTATVRLSAPQGRPHPDIIAIAALTILEPWCRERFTIAGGVSAQFAETVANSFGIAVGPVDGDLTARPRGGRTGLMYSGGPDCMAAEMLLDERLPFFHFRRVRHPRMPNRMTHVRVDIQEELVRSAEARGEEVHVAESDLEYLCRPFPTFPQWNALTIGAALQADALDLGGLVTGRNISGMYLGWGSGFNPEGEREAAWEAVYAAVGLPLIQPLAGTTDVASKRLAEHHRLRDLARSCLLGSKDGPCRRCLKCALNELMDKARRRAPLGPDWDSRFSSNAALDPDRDLPYTTQHVIEYALPRIPDVDQTFLRGIRDRLRPVEADTEWVEKYYAPALAAHVPESCRAVVARSIEESIGFMSAEDERQLQGWTAVRG